MENAWEIQNSAVLLQKKNGAKESVQERWEGILKECLLKNCEAHCSLLAAVRSQSREPFQRCSGGNWSQP